MNSTPSSDPTPSPASPASVRRLAPAAQRNRDAIFAVLSAALSAVPTDSHGQGGGGCGGGADQDAGANGGSGSHIGGRILEIASGTGQHAVHMAAGLPGLSWYPSDPDASARASIEAWRRHESLPNLYAPIELDVCDLPWPEAKLPASPLTAVVCINMIHIAPWQAAEALFAGAAPRLADNGVLFLYGPYKRGGLHTAPSNEAFDAQLRSTDSRWGVRDLEAVSALGAAQGLTLAEIVAMPANNLSLVFRRTQP